ncbi:MAG: hypothetical protein IH946_01630 [Bacteroidetes bacterium]|nr:hypothetical protein [Bacteroidota bacterium]
MIRSFLVTSSFLALLVVSVDAIAQQDVKSAENADSEMSQGQTQQEVQAPVFKYDPEVKRKYKEEQAKKMMMWAPDHAGNKTKEQAMKQAKENKKKEEEVQQNNEPGPVAPPKPDN